MMVMRSLTVLQLVVDLKKKLYALPAVLFIGFISKPKQSAYKIHFYRTPPKNGYKKSTCHSGRCFWYLLLYNNFLVLHRFFCTILSALLKVLQVLWRREISVKTVFLCHSFGHVFGEMTLNEYIRGE